MEKFTNILEKMNNEIINIKGIDINQSNHKIFTNISLKIQKGEFLYLIGDTGSGKSSLLNLLSKKIADRLRKNDYISNNTIATKNLIMNTYYLKNLFFINVKMFEI